ncbi:long-chain-fatty-acid--CoA ligase (plasmid) [Tistrella bauzanensis]|uniref:Long-chain-fatty-acid--CoA ligase n=1 Tax=Tistrella arctica TaxID=3133430 RepID=A0ABU9YL39_9PROT
MLSFYDATRTLADIPDLHDEGTALIFGDRVTTYPDLRATADRVAAALVASGLGRHARVGFLGLDSDRAYALLFGCARAGMVFVPVNWKLEPDDLRYIMADSGAELLFVSADMAGVARDIADTCQTLRGLVVMDGTADTDGGTGGATRFEDWLEKGAAAPDRDAADPDAPVIQVYTSGTSGRPKGVVLCHRGFIDLVREIERAGDDFIDWRPGDVSLLALPSFHVGGLWWAIQGLINGAANIVLPAFTGAAALTAIGRHRATKLAFVPAMLRFMLSEPAAATTDVSSVGLVIYGGSPMPRPILDAAQALFRCRFAQNYGLSETSNMAIFLPAPEHAALAAAGSTAAGRPLRGVGLKIIDAQGNPLPPGQTGEIAFHTPTRMLGYWNQPEATARALVDGWILTGDAGHVDADGYLHITDRIKDLIISAGENIYPAEIERVLAAHPDIDDVAVIGIPDKRWGEVPLAYVVARPGSGLTRAAVMAHARETIAAFKMIRDVAFIDRLPRNPAGKILKRVLREPHWAGQGRGVN